MSADLIDLPPSEVDAGSAATSETGKKRGRAAKPIFPGAEVATEKQKTGPDGKPVFDANGNPVNEIETTYTKYAEREVNGVKTYIPDGFNPEKYASLSRQNFTSLHDYWMYRSEIAKLEVKIFEDKAAAALLGSDSPVAREQKLGKYIEGAAKLFADLKAQGVDITAMLANLSPEAKKIAETLAK